MKKENRNLVIGLLIIFLAFPAGWWLSTQAIRLADKAIKRSERVECNQWYAQSQVYVGWYSTSWQREQCKQFGIILKP